MHVWVIAFEFIIGWGSFVNPGKKFLPNSGVAGTAIALLLGALVTFAIASWAYVGFDTIPQASEELNFFAQKVIGIMIISLEGPILVRESLGWFG